MGWMQRVSPHFFLRRLIRFYPPYLGANVRVSHVDLDSRLIKVEMGLHFWNLNYVGTQFGGSLYSMVDPWYFFLIVHDLGRDYIVWDKQATIKYLSPGKGRVYADFQISDEEMANIREEADTKGKIEPRFMVQVVDGKGTVVAEVEKVLSVRRKDRSRPKDLVS